MALVSCASFRYVAREIPAIDGITLIYPYSNILYIAKDECSYDEQRSTEQQNILTNLLMSSGIPIKDIISVEGRENQKELDADISFLPNINPKEVEYLNTDGPLDKLLEQNGSRFGLVIYAEGFVKDKALYKSEVAGAIIGSAVGGLIGGVVAGALGSGVAVGYIGSPGMQYGSGMSAMLIDTYTDKVLFYNRVKPVERDPMDRDVLTSQLEKLLKKFPR